MPKLSDYVMKACVVGDRACSLTAKCRICKKEIADINEIDKMFKDIISDISFLRQSEKFISPDKNRKDDVPK
jgi:hypothetical protein